MGVAVYPRLGELLRASNLTVAELGRHIEQLYGLSVDRGTLERLVSTDRIEHADLEVAGAAAAVLGVGLDDLFEVEATLSLAAEESVLDPEQSRRLAELLDAQDRRVLSAAERSEAERLVAEYGWRFRERLLPEIAGQRGIPIEQARRDPERARRGDPVVAGVRAGSEAPRDVGSSGETATERAWSRR